MKDHSDLPYFLAFLSMRISFLVPGGRWFMCWTNADDVILMFILTGVLNNPLPPRGIEQPANGTNLLGVKRMRSGARRGGSWFYQAHCTSRLEGPTQNSRTDARTPLILYLEGDACHHTEGGHGTLTIYTFLRCSLENRSSKVFGVKQSDAVIRTHLHILV